jgi:hypothetical protein
MGVINMCKVPVIFGPMLIKLKFCRQILVKAQTESFTKIRPVGADLFHADRRTERRDEANSRVLQTSRTRLKSTSHWIY